MSDRNKQGLAMFMSNMKTPIIENLRDSKVGTEFNIRFEHINKVGAETLNVVLTDRANSKNRFSLNQDVFKLSHIYVAGKEALASMQTLYKWDYQLYSLSSHKQDEKLSPQELSASAILTLEQCFGIRPGTTIITEETRLRVVHKVVVHTKDAEGNDVPKIQDCCYKGFETFERSRKDAIDRHHKQLVSVSGKKAKIKEAREVLLSSGLKEGIRADDSINHLYGNIYELIND